MTKKLTIADHVKMAGDTSKRVRRETGTDLQPMLHLVTRGEQIELAMLVIEGRGRDIALAARQTILIRKPKHAVLIVEGWTARKDLMDNHDDPDIRALIAGAITPSQLPPHKRGESINVIGESATGETAHAIYYIEPAGGYSEQYVSWKVPTEEKGEMLTHFHPMFLDHHLMRNLDPELKEIMIGGLGSESALYELVNRTCLKFLQSGLAGDPVEYTREIEKRVAQAREQIGWRKGRQAS